MVKTFDDYLANKAAYANLEIQVPNYSAEDVKKQTSESPKWLHFGGGNLYRAFHVEIADKLLNLGLANTGIVLVETYDEEIIEKMYVPNLNRNLQIVMKADGTLTKKLFAATTHAYTTATASQEQFEEISKFFINKSVQLVTMCITEKGYSLVDGKGEYTNIVNSDIENGPDALLSHAMSIVTGLMYKRFKNGKDPIALVSTDNFSQNGKRFRESVLKIANEWLVRNYVTEDFIHYLSDDSQVSFPWTMIDRITPNPSKEIAAKLEESGIENIELISTKKHTNIATFANTEETNYLVIEDKFPNGRPKFEDVGVYLVDRDTVEKADEMKVTTCLNPLHTSLAVFGCLLKYQSISAEMKDEDLVRLIKGIGYVEGLPVVVNPKIIDPKQFIDEVVEKRLPNPFIPDTPQRIATDTSQKMAIRFGETIRKYAESASLDVQSLTFIPLTIAGWCRYLLGVDDEGNPFTPSPDPLLETLQKSLVNISLGKDTDIHEALQPILANVLVFGCDLYSIGLGEKIEKMFSEMIEGPGAIRKVLKKYTK